MAYGKLEERKLAFYANADITVISRDNLRWAYEQKLLKGFDVIVADESSSFKSRKAGRTKALAKTKTKRMIMLSATPAPNGLLDLWAQYRILDGGERLGRFLGQYRETYFLPDKRNGVQVFSYKLRSGAEGKIYDKISDITVSQTSTGKLKMPELVINDIYVKLDDAERKKYETLKREAVLELPGGEITAVNAAVLSGKLLQMANGAVYDDDGKTQILHNCKLDALEDLIEQQCGRPLLVCISFRHDRERIMQRFTEAREIKTDSDVSDWNVGKIPLAVMHPKSCGHGLNLQKGGAAMCWFALTWSCEEYEQAVGRLWRQGQTSETVVIHRIITAGTFDERVIAAITGKQTTQSALIEALKGELK